MRNSREGAASSSVCDWSCVGWHAGGKLPVHSEVLVGIEGNEACVRTWQNRD